MDPVSSQGSISASNHESSAMLEDVPAIVRLPDGSMLQPSDNISLFLSTEFDMSRLERMNSWLWLAGRLGNIRPLHRQHELGRRLIITESLGLHLVWKNDMLFLKPLPSYLLDDSFIEQYVQKDTGLLAASNSLLLTYCYLINHRSDFLIAVENNLVPAHLRWEDWKALVSSRLKDIITHHQARTLHCLPRFHFGELRLSRINMIYRLVFAKTFFQQWRGYATESETYQSFLHRYLAWLVAIFAYITIVLTAMQVGLGTEQLQFNTQFNRACYGFTVFSILLPPAAIVAVGLVSSILTYYHVTATREHLRASKYNL